MTDTLSRDLALLIEIFEAGDWREVRVDSEAVSVLLSRDLEAWTDGDREAALPVVAARPPEPAPPAHEAKPAPAQAVPADEGWRAVIAPNLGTFYRSPKPGAAPFVEVGDTVRPDTEICLLEVMKLFTSVTAGIDGVVRQIAARDAELVEGGQTLFYIEPNKG